MEKKKKKKQKRKMNDPVEGGTISNPEKGDSPEKILRPGEEE